MARKKNAKVTDVQLTKPQSRLERYLGTIAGLFSDAPSDPRTRLERYLDAIVSGGVPITPDTPTSVEGLLYGNSQGKIEGVASDLSPEEIAARLEAASLISQYPRPNLLDNAYFVGGGSQQGGGQFPINQRAGYVVPDGVTYYSDDALTTSAGTTSAYTTAVYVNTTYGTIDVGGTTYYVAYGDMVPGYVGAGYGIDKWKSDGAILLINSESITIINTNAETTWPIYQILESFPNEQVTGSAIVEAITGNAQFVAQQIGASFDTPFLVEAHQGLVTGSGHANYPASDIKYRVGFVLAPGASITIKAVKLELGANQTLAHRENGVLVLNEIPNFQQELAKCQRYQIALFGLYGQGYIGPLQSNGDTLAYGVIPIPVTLRVAPLFKAIGPDDNFSNFMQLWDKDAQMSNNPVTNIATYSLQNNGIQVEVSFTSPLNTGYAGYLYRKNSNYNIILDANL